MPTARRLDVVLCPVSTVSWMPIVRACLPPAVAHRPDPPACRASEVDEVAGWCNGDGGQPMTIFAGRLCADDRRVHNADRHPLAAVRYQGAATVGTHLGSSPVAVRLPFVSECMVAALAAAKSASSLAAPRASGSGIHFWMPARPSAGRARCPSVRPRPAAELTRPLHGVDLEVARPTESPRRERPTARDGHRYSTQVEGARNGSVLTAAPVTRARHHYADRTHPLIAGDGGRARNRHTGVPR